MVLLLSTLLLLLLLLPAWIPRLLWTVLAMQCRFWLPGYPHPD
jgi:hypothetical protein